MQTAHSRDQTILETLHVTSLELFWLVSWSFRETWENMSYVVVLFSGQHLLES